VTSAEDLNVAIYRISITNLYIVFLSKYKKVSVFM